VRLYPLKDKNKITAPALWLKTLLRSPAKSALTLLLIAAATFMFLYNLLEYTITDRQYREAMAQYWGNIAVDRPHMADGESVPKDSWENFEYYYLSDKDANPAYNEKIPYGQYHKDRISAAEAKEIAQLPYIDDVSTRYMTAGISDEFTRIDTHSDQNLNMWYKFSQYNSRVVIEATVVRHDVKATLPVAISKSNGMIADVLAHNVLVKDVKLLAGEDLWPEDRDYRADSGEYVISYIESAASVAEEKDNFHTIDSHGHLNYSVNHIPEGFQETLVKGERYIFVCKANIMPPEHEKEGEVRTRGFLYLGDDSIYNWWPYACNITGLPENYLETEEFAPLRELIQVTNDDIHTLDVVYAEEMRTIRRYQEGKLLLMEGRLLNERDTAEKHPVCVVAETFAEHYGLKVGDTISLRLGDKLFENYAPLGAVASFKARYANNFTEKQDFEIVGLYHETGMEALNADLRYWVYSENAIFVPQSFLPVSAETLVDWEFGPADISFIVSDANNIMAFAENGLPMLDEMGYISYWSDSRWPEIGDQLKQTGLLSLLKLATFSAAVVLVLLLAMYVFVIQRKTEFAVMRALGCPKSAAIKTVLLPLTAIAVVGVCIGAVAAVKYTSLTLADKLQSYATFGHEVDIGIPVAAVALSIIGCFALLIIFAALGLVYIARMKPLELLQGGNRRRKRRTQTNKPAEIPPAAFDMAAIRSLTPVEVRKRPSIGFLWRYIAKHARRSAGKSLLLILATALIIGAMGQFAAVRGSYKELYNAIDVKVRFLDFEHHKAEKFAETDYVTGGYYEYNFVSGEMPLPEDDTSYVYASYCLNNDLLHNVAQEVTFIEGYSAEDVMLKNERICVMPRFMLDELGLELGDTVELNEFGFLSELFAFNYDLTLEQALEIYHRHSVKVQIVGCIEGGDRTIYIPLAGKVFFKSLFDGLYLSLAEYSLADYHKAIELRGYAKTLLEPNGLHRPRFSMDTSEADRIYNTYQMLETLYPIAFTAAALIGAIIMALLILQRAKEAATLRILGTAKGRTRAMLTVEQILLCILGLALALAALVTFNGTELMKTADSISVYMTAHLLACGAGCAIAAAKVTRRKVLDMLQVKE